MHDRKKPLTYGLQLPEKVVKTLSKIETYADTEVWSHRWIHWCKFIVKKPRLPTPQDEVVQWIDLPKFRPITFSMHMGKHNDECIKTLRLMIQQFENTRSLPQLIVFNGRSGTGKSSLAYSFTIELMKDIPDAKRSKFIMRVNAQDHIKDFDKLWRDISKFDDILIDATCNITFKVLLIDNMDVIPSSGQFALKKLIDSSSKLRFILITRDKKKLLAAMQDKANNITTRVCKEKICLLIILNILQKLSVGYDVEGLQMAFSLSPVISISEILTLTQKTFVEHGYVSRENVARTARVKADAPTVTAIAAVQPLKRCNICTLFPPCSHFTYKDMVTKSSQVRDALPRYEGGMLCPEWKMHGFCSIYSKFGHCSLDHPKDIHNLQQEIVRCPCCTIRWPCNLCDYSRQRQKVQILMDRCHYLMKTLVIMISPNAPMSLIGHLDAVDTHWHEILISLDHIYNNRSKIDLLHDLSQWLASSYTTDAAEYTRKIRSMRRDFGGLISNTLFRNSSEDQSVVETIDDIMKEHVVDYL